MSLQPSWQTVALADVAPVPWRNGGGTTRELLAWPPGADWQLRLSVAEVAQAGPFSEFPGVLRWFAVLHGAGVRLQIQDHLHSLTPTSPPLAFDGAVPVHCAPVAGPTLDFNLMVRGGTARMQRLQGDWNGPVDAMTFIAIYAQGKRATARFGSEITEIAPETLAWCRTREAGTFSLAGDDALWMEVKLDH